MTRLIDIEAVTTKIGMSKRWVWREVSTKRFPQPVPLGNGRAARWAEEEVDGWIRKSIENRDKREQPTAS